MREPGHAQLRVSSLPFSEIPGQSRLFLDYLKDPGALKGLYPNAPASLNDLRSFAPTVLAAYTIDRHELCDALLAINSGINAGPQTLGNIELLRQSDTVAVVTGQQAGLFTGPLYTIYKALSAIKLAKELNRQGTKAVPVFWAATEDHDFAEVSNAFFIDKDARLAEITYWPDSDVEATPVGHVRIEDSIGPSIDRMFADLPGGEFSAELRELLRRSWSPGEKFGAAFLKTLATLLGKYGLVFIDSLNERIKVLSAPVYRAAVTSADEIVAALTARARELESAGYHTQVNVGEDYYPLFWHDDGGRRKALRRHEAGVYRVKGERIEITRAQIEEIASEQSDRLSPGVMLRPVVQDYLLPTVCYFGGAAEIAYFAQNSEVYRVLGRPATPILHRQSLTVVEPKHRRVLEKLNLKFAQLFEGENKLRLRLAETETSNGSSRLLSGAEETINSELSRLSEHVAQIDPTLADNFARRRRKMLYHIGAMREKIFLAEARRDEVLGRRLENLYAALLPNGALQERSLNVFSYLNEFGPAFLDWIYDSIDLNDRDHRIMYV